MSASEHDVVLYGATGFTGRLVADHLAAHAGDARWAIAGRNAQKLEAVVAELGQDVPIIVADAGDPASLAAMVEQAKVICTTVGPYATHGDALVEACAATGTHCCDLTGEVHWMRRMIDAHHETAVASGARIVHTCGFDCIPADLGTWFTQQQVQATHGVHAEHVDIRVVGIRGGASGGTIASLLTMFEEAEQDRSILRMLRDPYALTPDWTGPDHADTPRPTKDSDGTWTSPWLMEIVDTKVVRRTNALLGHPWGTDFRVTERFLAGRGPVGLAKAATVAGGMAGLSVGAAIGPIRRLVGGRLPAPGTGPSERAREAGYWDFRITGTTADGQSLRVRAKGDRDPGYGSTARMLGEAALCLATDDLDGPGGHLTPAAAMGDALIERLRARAGITFAVEG